MDYANITTDEQLRDYCAGLAGAASIAFDTEFVSENTYRPVLCLVQVAARDQFAVLDAVTISDLRPFWETITAAGHETIVHAGRGELEFCWQAVGRLPERLFDVQLAAGMVGIEYPAGFSTLVARVLGRDAKKHETRTDWQRRPLTKRQIDYAVEDVYYLPAIRDRLHTRLVEMGRAAWMEEEMECWKEEFQRAESHERWRRVSGNAGLDPRSLAIVRELWKWREAEAQRRNQPARRVLRDDLIVELARRQTADPKRISAVRGLERGDLRRRLDEIAGCIQRAIELPQEEYPARPPKLPSAQTPVLGQLLFAALSSICRQAEIAPNLVGGPNDIRDWIAYHAAHHRGKRRPPRLAQGWRAEFVGRLFDDLLAGKLRIRIVDPESDHPLVIEPAN